MSDNQSFLKLIGFEEEPTPDHKDSVVEESFTHEFDAESELEKTELVDTPELTKTEVYEEQVEEQTSGEPTQLYSSQEIEAIGILQREILKEVSFISPKESTSTVRSNTKSIRAVVEQTRGTIPLIEQDNVSEQNEERTAYFEYSSEPESGGGRLVVLDGKTNGKAFYLNQLPLRIGRDPQNEIILDDYNSSRFHAEIQDDQGILKIVDLGSTNGLKINGKILTEHVLESHDVIQIGDCLLEYLPSGELSKGLPQSQVMAETASVHPAAPKKKKLFMVAAAMLLIAGALFLFQMPSGDLAKKAQEVVIHQAEDELQGLKKDLSAKYQKPMEEIPANEIKKALVDRLQSSSVGAMIPEALRNQLDQLSPEIVKIFMLDQALVNKVMASGGNPQAMDLVLREKLNDLIVQKQYALGLGLAKALLQTDPNSSTLKNAVDHLEEMAKGPAARNEDEKKFFEYIEKFDKNFQDLISARKFDEALAFGLLVKEKLVELLKMEPLFESVANPEMKKWDARIAAMKKQVADAEVVNKRRNENQRKEDERFIQLKALWDLGDFSKIVRESERFLKDFPNSNHSSEILSMKKDVEGNLSKAFEKTRAEVEQQLQTESYESAWKTLYLFIDALPGFKPAEALKDRVELLTRARAVQYYNQARVYEYEADDLIAAEQHYKKSVELADPRSDLHKKSLRRFEDVRRKNMK